MTATAWPPRAGHGYDALVAYFASNYQPDGALAWQDDALCAEVDGELFFPEKGESTAPAKRVCMACSVRTECLESALDRDEQYGIFGGLSVRERRKLNAARRAEEAA